MSKSWSEVQALLDDPYVSADTKEMLLVAYLRENGARDFPPRIPQEAMPYLEDYNLKGDNLPFGLNMSTDAAAAAAQRESDDMGYAGRQRDQQVQEDSAELEGMQPPAAGGAGVETSDELFDLAKSALTMFEKFLPVNARVPDVAMHRNGAVDFGRDVQTLFDEQRGINFKKFLEEAERLREAHGVLSGLQTTTETQLNSLYQTWTGPAANASYDYYTREITPNTTELLSFLETAPGMIETAVQTVYDACKSKCDQVIAMYQSTMGSATPEIADKVVTLARGEFDSQEQVLEVAAWVDSVCGSNLESTIRADDCGLNDGNKQYVISECKKWIRESFNVDLHDAKVTPFKQLCEDTCEAVDDAWETLNTYLKDYENEFGAAPTVTQPAPPPTSSTPPPTSSTPPPSTTPSNTTSGSTPTPSTPSVPSVPSIPTSPGSGDTGGSPGTGGSTTPSGDTGATPGPGGSPGTGDTPGGPGQPLPAPAPGEPETVTITDGDREISVTSPDGQGRVKVTIDDGTGNPKTYELDFGAGSTPGTVPGGVPGTDPSGGDLSTLPYMPGGGSGQEPDTGGQPGTNMPTVDPVTGQPVDADTPVQAGPDGKCVITDGPLTITAERPSGSPDSVVVTIDDGTGKPTTYTLDYSDPASPTADRSDGPGMIRAQPVDDSGDNGGRIFDTGVVYAHGEPAGQPDTATPGVTPATEPVMASQADPAQFTSAQGNLGGDGGMAGVGGGQAGSYGVPATGYEANMPSSGGSGTGSGEASLAGASDQGGNRGHGGGMAGGMPMLGGTGPGGSGGDGERTPGHYSIAGDLFDTGVAAGAGGTTFRISGSLDDDLPVQPDR